MRRQPQAYLDHVLESIQLIEEYTAGATKEDFLQSVKLQDLVMRRLEIIGEAVKHLPDEIKIANPDIPWKKIGGMRDVLIHEYFGVDLNLTWEAVQKNLPMLKLSVEKIRKGLST